MALEKNKEPTLPDMVAVPPSRLYVSTLPRAKGGTVKNAPIASKRTPESSPVYVRCTMHLFRNTTKEITFRQVPGSLLGSEQFKQAFRISLVQAGQNAALTVETDRQPRSIASSQTLPFAWSGIGC